ncbi:MAG: phosphatase PAP2 family protein [Patescibacteria group bacterium]
MDHQIFFSIYNFGQNFLSKEFIIFFDFDFSFIVLILAFFFFFIKLLIDLFNIPDVDLIKAASLNPWSFDGNLIIFQFIRICFPTFISIIITELAGFCLKILFHTPRPFLVFSNIQTLVSESSFSFPADHTSLFVALAISIFLINKKVGSVFIFFSFLIGISHIMSGIHFPMNIFGDFILGTIITLITHAVIKKKL